MIHPSMVCIVLWYDVRLLQVQLLMCNGPRLSVSNHIHIRVD